MTETELKWLDRVREWKASGKTAKEFVEGRDFKASTLAYWASCLRRVREEGQLEGRSAARPPEPRVRMAPVVPVSCRAEDAIVISVGAARVTVRAGFDQGLLRQVVQALGGE
jgi:hypothetical protein